MCGYDYGYPWGDLVCGSEIGGVHARYENESEDRKGGVRWSGSENGLEYSGAARRGWNEYENAHGLHRDHRWWIVSASDHGCGSDRGRGRGHGCGCDYCLRQGTLGREGQRVHDCGHVLRVHVSESENGRPERVV